MFLKFTTRNENIITLIDPIAFIFRQYFPLSISSKMRGPEERAQEVAPKYLAGIARIAYAQADVITRYESQEKNELPVVPKDGSKNIFQLPIFTTITSTFCKAYTTVKHSNETIANILNQTEETFGKSSKFIGSTIEKLPSIDVPSESIIEDIKLNLRITFLTTIEWCENIVSNVINAYNNLSITNEDKSDKTKGNNSKSFK